MVRKGRAPCCDKTKVKRGPWSPAEDAILISFIREHGHPNWRSLPQQAGLLRCGKSCRLRWINYLRPDVKRGNFSPEEEETIIRMHKSMGNKWSMIAAQLPGRTDNEIKNVWNTHLKKKLVNCSATESLTGSSSPSSGSGSGSTSTSSCISNSNGDMTIISNLDKKWSGSQRLAAEVRIMEGDQNQPEHYNKDEESLSPHYSNISTINNVDEHQHHTTSTTNTKEEGRKVVSDEKSTTPTTTATTTTNYGIPLDCDVEFWNWFKSLEDEQTCEFGGEEHADADESEKMVLGEEGKELKKWLKQLENELGLSDGGEEESENDFMSRRWRRRSRLSPGI